MTDTDKLKRLAEAAMTASPAPWLYRSEKYDDWGVVRASDGWPLLQVSVNRHSQDELARHRGAKTDPVRAEAEYIAAANPQAILALIAENERLSGALKAANDGFEKHERLWYLAKDERDEAVALLRECEVEMRSDVESRYDKDDVDSYPSIRGNYLQDIDTPNRSASFLARIDTKDAP